MSIAIHARGRRVPTRLIATAALACGLIVTGLAQAAAPTPSLQQQRNAFRSAYAAAQDGQDWRKLAKGLKDYPLYPYLEAAALRHDLKTASTAAVDAYLKRYAGMIPAADLREAKLRSLAKQQDWKTFEHFYRPGLGSTLTCDHLQARLASGHKLDFKRDLADLWQETGLPSACTPVLDAAFTQGLLTPTRVWDRIERAADAGRSGTVRFSSQWLSGDAATSAKRITEALRHPERVLKSADKPGDTPRNREAIARALSRLARRDSAQALAYWQSLSKRFRFSEAQRNQTDATLALYNAVDRGPDAVARLAALPAAAQTDATREWRVRAAVADADWKAAATAIAALTPAQMRDGQWRYWKARVAQKLGHGASALSGYTRLARRATFYGFLAADRANLPYSICPATITPDQTIERKLEGNPGITRAFEFFELGMYRPARREWHRAFGDLTPTLQVHAAALASWRGWYDRAIFAFGRSGDDQYYALRFPLADRQRVVTAARDTGIAPAWAFAIIRAETAWQPDARSGADARGLMQLLPSTAREVARRSGLPYDGADSLYDPAVNIALGTRYLARLALRFNGSPWLATASYNAGPGNVNRWLDIRANLTPEAFILNIPFNATRAYVTRVLSFSTIYDWRLNGKPVPVSSRMPAIGSAYDPTANRQRKPVICRARVASGSATAPSPRKE